MKEVVFDLETIADPECVKDLPPVTPDSRLKDPAKIKEQIAEKQLKQIEDMGKNPTQNLICCASFNDLGLQKVTSFMLNPETMDEAELLRKVWEFVYSYERFISFNGISFDVEVLKFHSMLRRVPMSVAIGQKKYQTGNHMDLRMLLVNWDVRAHGTQDFFCRRLLGRGKPADIDGSMVQHWWDCGGYDEIKEYCEGDVRDIGDLYRVGKGYYW